MMEIRLDYWKLPQELALMLGIVLRREPEIPEDLDWNRFEAALRQHRVQPLLIRGLRSMNAETVAQFPTLKKYQGQQNKYTMESLERLRALAQVSTALADAGIRMISMKGPLLSMELYGDPSLRTSRDLDVMVEESDLKRAGEILAAMGYALEEGPFHKTPLRRKYYSIIEQEKHEVYTKGSICIELHWKGNFQTEESFDELWDKREEQMILGRPIAIMGADDRYPALIIHAAEHGFLRLRWLLDLYELQKKPQFSWEKIYHQMCAQGVGELLIETMLVMYRLDLPGLKGVSWNGLSLTREEGRLCLRISDALEQNTRKAVSLCEAVYPLLLREVQRTDREWKDYDRCLPVCMVNKTFTQSLLINFGPSTYELELIDLPDSLFWLYFIIRPFHWLWRKLIAKKHMPNGDNR